MASLEKELALLAQYGRRESIEILNIPKSVGINQLEGKAIEILGNIGVVVQPKDIVAVHRLRDPGNGKAPSTIIRFVNRKHAFLSLKNKKKLINCEEIMGLRHLFMVENLCPTYKHLFEKCKKLKQNNIIKFLWTKNGIIQIRYTDNKNETPIKILHEDDYDYYFGDEESYWSHDE